jgi:TonB family protein
MTTVPASQRLRRQKPGKFAGVALAAASRLQSLRLALSQLSDRLPSALEGIVARVTTRLANADYTRRAASIALVAVTNLALLWIFLASLGPLPGLGPVHEIHAVLIDGHDPQPTVQPDLVKPDADIIPAPDIQITEDAPAAAVSQIDSASMALVLAPRPDPSHRNDPFVFAAPLKTAAPASIVLRILVMPDGSISDAQVTSSSGQPGVDATAVAYVKAHWRYLPATLAGRSLQYWTTVIVPVHTA